MCVITSYSIHYTKLYELNKIGFKELWIIRLVAGYRVVKLIPGEDSLAFNVEQFPEPDSLLSPAEQSAMQLNSFRLMSNALV